MKNLKHFHFCYTQNVKKKFFSKKYFHFWMISGILLPQEKIRIGLGKKSRQEKQGKGAFKR